MIYSSHSLFSLFHLRHSHAAASLSSASNVPLRPAAAVLKDLQDRINAESVGDQCEAILALSYFIDVYQNDDVDVISDVFLFLASIFRERHNLIRYMCLDVFRQVSETFGNLHQVQGPVLSNLCVVMRSTDSLARALCLQSFAALSTCLSRSHKLDREALETVTNSILRSIDQIHTNSDQRDHVERVACLECCEVWIRQSHFFASSVIPVLGALSQLPSLSRTERRSLLVLLRLARSQTLTSSFDMVNGGGSGNDSEPANSVRNPQQQRTEELQAVNKCLAALLEPVNGNDNDNDDNMNQDEELLSFTDDSRRDGDALTSLFALARSAETAAQFSRLMFCLSLYLKRRQRDWGFVTPVPVGSNAPDAGITGPVPRSSSHIDEAVLAGLDSLLIARQSRRFFYVLKMAIRSGVVVLQPVGPRKAARDRAIAEAPWLAFQCVREALAYGQSALALSVCQPLLTVATDVSEPVRLVLRVCELVARSEQVLASALATTGQEGGSSDNLPLPFTDGDVTESVDLLIEAMQMMDMVALMEGCNDDEPFYRQYLLLRAEAAELTGQLCLASGLDPSQAPFVFAVKFDQLSREWKQLHPQLFASHSFLFAMVALLLERAAPPASAAPQRNAAEWRARAELLLMTHGQLSLVAGGGSSPLSSGVQQPVASLRQSDVASCATAMAPAVGACQRLLHEALIANAQPPPSLVRQIATLLTDVTKFPLPRMFFSVQNSK